MSAKLFSKDDLIAAGWNDRQIDAALDAPDDVGPSGHWLNSSGKPYFRADRVAVAAYRIGLNPRGPTPAEWAKWETSASPTCRPLLTFNFHRLASVGLKDAAHQFWSLRLSHRIAGRQPGTREREGDLIREILLRLVAIDRGAPLGSSQDLLPTLATRATTVGARLGDPWPSGVVFRRVSRPSYVSTAVGKKSIQRFLDVLSLVHTGQVRDVNDQRQDLIDFLVEFPQMRFDRKHL